MTEPIHRPSRYGEPLEPRPAPGALARGEELPLLLVCDHRGERLLQRVACLESQGWRLESSTGLQQSLEKLEHLRPELILLQTLVRGGVVELDALDQARAGDPPVPLLLVIDGESPLSSLLSSRAMGGRAWDLVYHSASAEEYVVRLHRLLLQRRDLLQMRDWRERARHDDRTRLLRPQAFEEHLLQSYSAAERHGLALALVLIDLDRFGEVNKQHDHTVGDELIARVGGVIRAGLRSEDSAGRLGGDEFGVLLPFTGLAEAQHVIQRLRQSIQRIPTTGLGMAHPIVASAGFETFDGKDLGSPKELRRNAELALQGAKRSGGNCALYYRGLLRSDELAGRQA